MPRLIWRGFLCFALLGQQASEQQWAEQGSDGYHQHQFGKYLGRNDIQLPPYFCKDQTDFTSGHHALPTISFCRQVPLTTKPAASLPINASSIIASKSNRL